MQTQSEKNPQKTNKQNMELFKRRESRKEMFKKLNQAGWYTPIISGKFLRVKLQSEI